MKDTTGIEETIRRVVSAAVEREVAEGPAGEATVALRRGARSVELREAGSGWLVAWQGRTAQIDGGDGKLVPGLTEALELAVRLLDAEREGSDKEEEERTKARTPVMGDEHTTTNGVGLRIAALSSSTTPRSHRPDTPPSTASPSRPHLPTGPERGRGGRSL